MRKLAPIPPLAMLVVVLTLTPAAWASWGGGECHEGGPAGHCYSVTYWSMSQAAGESVKGLVDVPYTTTMNVPEYYNNAFVNDESWLSFTNAQSGWLEIGQTAGSSRGSGESSCCTLHPFIAHSLTSTGAGYEQYFWWGVNASPQNIYKIEDPANNGNWCEYIWENVVDCHTKPGYWPAYATELQAGMEVYTNGRPSNAGSQQVAAIARNGEHRAWGGSVNPARGYISPGPNSTHELCLTPNWDSNHPGNADWGTC